MFCRSFIAASREDIKALAVGSFIPSHAATKICGCGDPNRMFEADIPFATKKARFL
jgi:hypothetical protein